MEMNVTYFGTRTLARAAVSELNGTFKDFGTDAPKGERWAVLCEVPNEVQHDMSNEIALLQALVEKEQPRVVLSVNRTVKGGNVLNRFPRSNVKNLKGKTIPVYSKRNNLAA